jgi:proliferating cell nuclear antigen
MFEAAMGSASVWKRCIDAISTIIEEGTFTVRSDKIRFRAIDPARISMVDFYLDSEKFEKYELEGSKDIGVNLEDMNKILKRARPGDRLKLSLDEQANRFIITLEGLSVTTFSIPLLDLGMDQPPDRTITFTTTIRMESGVFSEALKNIAIIEDYVQLRATPDFFRLEGESTVESVDVRMSRNSEGIAHMEVKEDSKAMFILSNIQNMLRAAEPTDIVELEFGDDLPLKLTVPLEGGQISFLLAPRVQD